MKTETRTAQFERLKLELESTFAKSLGTARPLMLEAGFCWKALPNDRQ